MWFGAKIPVDSGLSGLARHRFGRTQEWTSPRDLSGLRRGSNSVPGIAQLFLPTVRQLGYSCQPPTRLRGRVDLARVVLRQAPFETRRTTRASPVVNLAGGQMIPLIEIVMKSEAAWIERATIEAEMTPSGIAGRQNARNGGRVSAAIPLVSVSSCHILSRLARLFHVRDASPVSSFCSPLYDDVRRPLLAMGVRGEPFSVTLNRFVNS
jgi:hypothetical protein